MTITTDGGKVFQQSTCSNGTKFGWFTGILVWSKDGGKTWQEYGR